MDGRIYCCFVFHNRINLIVDFFFPPLVVCAKHGYKLCNENEDSRILVLYIFCIMKFGIDLSACSCYGEKTWKKKSVVPQLIIIHQTERKFNFNFGDGVPKLKGSKDSCDTVEFNALTMRESKTLATVISFVLPLKNVHCAISSNIYMFAIFKCCLVGRSKNEFYALSPHKINFILILFFAALVFIVL